MFDFLKTPILHHAYLLVGWPEGTLDFLRQELGLALGVPNPLSSPDYIEDDFSVLGIKDSQNLRERQTRTAFGPVGQFFVLTVSSATIEAQNALLKTLEEPAPGVHFFILARSEEMFLPTLKSRFVVIKPAANQIIKETLGEREAAEFLNLSLPARLEYIRKNFLKNKEVGKKELFIFLDNLEKKLYANYRAQSRQPINLTVLSEIFQAKKNLNNPRSSARLILEHLSLVL